MDGNKKGEERTSPLFALLVAVVVLGSQQVNTGKAKVEKPQMLDSEAEAVQSSRTIDSSQRATPA